MAKRIIAAVVWLTFVALLCGSAPTTIAQDANELAVVVHPSRAGSVGPLSAGDLQAIFTRKKQFWSDGQKINTLNLDRGNPVRVGFFLYVV
jgi:hypothetical protein